MIGSDSIIIDFDYSSKKWMENKIKCNNGSFQYIII